MTQGQAVIILGMHRSGTSLLTGTLRRAGLHLGRVLDQNIDLNPTGLQEPEAVLFMHEDLLEKNGGTWHEPPEKITWDRLHKGVRDLFIESRAGIPVWGFKDPRTLLVLEGWLEVLPDAICVGIFRHPADVALSMARRNDFGLSKGYALWETYNRRLLHWHETRGVPIIEYASDPARMAAGLDGVVRHVRPDWQVDPEFYRADYYRNKSRDHDAPASAQTLYEELCARALT